MKSKSALNEIGQTNLNKHRFKIFAKALTPVTLSRWDTFSLANTIVNF